MKISIPVGLSGVAGVYTWINFTDWRLSGNVSPGKRWRSSDLEDFLKKLDSNREQLLLDCIDKADEEFTPKFFIREMIYQGNHILRYPFIDKDRINYHEMVVWCAEELGLDDRALKPLPTFAIERAIVERVFARVWDKVDRRDREKVLDEIADQELKRLAMQGAIELIKWLRKHRDKKKFYTSLSRLIVQSAIVLGVPIARALAAGIRLLANPVGLAIIGLAVLIGVYVLGSANPQRVAAMIVQIHMIKVQALHATWKLDSALASIPLYDRA